MGVAVEIGADLGPFLREMGGLSDAAAGEARQIARSFDNGLSEITSTSSRLTSKAGADFSELGTVAEKALKKMGAAGGELADVIFDFAEPLAGIASEMGTIGIVGGIAAGAITAIGLAAAATVISVTSLASASADAADRLEEAGRSAEIPASARESIEQYRSAQHELQVQTDLLLVSLGDKTGVIAAVTGANKLLADLTESADDVTSALVGFAGAAEMVNTALLPMLAITNPVIAGLDGFVSALVAGYHALVNYGSAEEQLDFTLPSLPATTENLAAFTELLGTGAPTSGGKPTASGALKATAKAAVEVNTKFVTAKNTIDAMTRALPRHVGQVEGVTYAYQELGEEADNVRKTFETTMKEIQGVAQGAADLVTGVTDVIIASYEAQAGAGNELTEQQKRTANAAAVVQKAVAAQMILVNAAVAFAGIVANLSVTGPVVAFATAASTVGAMLTALAGVIGTPLPFPEIGFGGGGKQGLGGEPISAPTDAGAAPGVGDNYKNDPGWGDQWGGAGAGGGGQTSRSSSVTVTLSRTAGQLLRVAPTGKTTRGVR